MLKSQLINKPTIGGQNLSDEVILSINRENLRKKGIGLLCTKIIMESIDYLLLPILVCGKIGFINSFAEIVIEANYDVIKGDFINKDSLVNVSIDGKWN